MYDGLRNCSLANTLQLSQTFEDIQESDEVGSEDMCEHGINSRAVMMVATRHLVGVIINERSSTGPRRLGREWR